jgi:hypothetical protein
MLLLILLSELIVLYFISRWLITTLFTFFLLVFRARSVAISIILVLEFPGTVVHELSHLFTAGILGVRTGKLTLEPGSIREDDITTGSVAIAETDPFRRYAIGFAPVVGGILILTTISYFLQNLGNTGNLGNWITWGLGYLLFSVSNAMFSSPQDLKGFVPFAITLGIFIGIFYWLGLRIDITGPALTVATQILTTLVSSLGIVLGVNMALWGITGLLTTLLTRLFHVKVS